MKSLLLAVIFMTSFSAHAQGFFKKPAAAETPAAAASKPQPAAPAAPTPTPAPAKPAPAQAVTPPPVVEAPPKPKTAERPRVQQRAAVPKQAPQPAASETPSQVVERPAAPRPAQQPAAPAAVANTDARGVAAGRGMVDPVAECAGGWGIKQAFCRSVQCQRAESFHHPVCVDMRAEQANRPPNLGGGG